MGVGGGFWKTTKGCHRRTLWCSSEDKPSLKGMVSVEPRRSPPPPEPAAPFHNGLWVSRTPNSLSSLPPGPGWASSCLSPDGRRHCGPAHPKTPGVIICRGRCCGVSVHMCVKVSKCAGCSRLREELGRLCLHSCPERFGAGQSGLLVTPESAADILQPCRRQHQKAEDGPQ